ncbi:Haemagglutinin [Oligella ureolytica]|uniref:Haemagglutinin n=1 Tax=Oligella ureolytica TaxID=90244 RepID=A0A378XGE9_9BURK|nr:ESPR-type extended signal peptide-containing protein [Oligella ureolytica]QPT39037.1 hypothetical protein I6G29_07430 [Oligella ureolytica]SUA54580.1 Haemagglutinin [Oligella ureolytica]
MNKIYKSIWNEQTGTYVAVSENTKAKGKRSSSALLASAILAAVLGTTAHAQETITVGVGDPVVGTKIVFKDETEATTTTLSNTGLTTSTGAFSGAVSAESLNVTNVANVGLLTVTGTTNLKGANLGGEKITNLANGTIGVNSTDAVTGGQLHSVQEQVNKGLQVRANEGTADPLTLGETLTLADGNNTTVEYNADNNTFKTDLKQDISLTSVTASSLVKAGSLEVANQAIVDGTLGVSGLTTLSGGAKLNDQKITDLGVGVIAEDSKDAVTGGQIHNLFFGEEAEGIKYFRANSTAGTPVDDDAQAIGDDSVAIGPDAKAEGNYSFAAGGGGKDENGDSVAGATTTEEGVGAIALGQGAVAGGSEVGAGGAGAISIGRMSMASGTSSVALGDDAKAQAANAAALGASALASGANSIAIGDSVAAGGNSFAAGTGATAATNDSIALGTSAGDGTDEEVNDPGQRHSFIAIGKNAGQNMDGNEMIAIGVGAGSNSSQSQQVSIGTSAGTFLNGERNVS